MAKKTKEPDIVEAAKSVMIQEATENCPYFISRLVYIESKGTKETEIKFDLWDVQKSTLTLMNKLRFLIFLKARQLGCTWLVLAYSLWVMLRPHKKVIALSKTEIDANALVQRVEFMLRHLPEWFIEKSSEPKKGKMTYDSTMTWVKIRHVEGEDSVLMSLPAAQNSGASLTADVVIMDEDGLMEWAEQIYRAAYPTINRAGDGPECGQVFIISTMRIGSFFHRMVLGARSGANDYKLVFWPWYSDPSRDQAWYERTLRNYTGNMKSDYPATIEEAISQADGCFFQEVDKEIHLKPKRTVLPYWQRYTAIDYGLDGVSVHWYYVDDQGMIRIYRELYDRDKIIPVTGQMIINANAGEDNSGFFAPADLWNRRQETGKSFTESFSELGLFLTKADNDREHGWELVKELLFPFESKDPQTGEAFMTAKLTIDLDDDGNPCAPELWRCLTTVQRDPANYNDVLDKKPEDHELTHCIDELRYFASGRVYPSKPGITKKKSAFDFDNDDEDGDFVKW